MTFYGLKTMEITQENNKQNPVGLGNIHEYNETVRSNSDLLNRLKAVFPEFIDKDNNFKKDKFEDELKENNISESRDGYKLGFVGKDYARLQVGLKTETMIVPDCTHNSLPENINSGNIFITGDNLEALRHLINAYENQIKLIYIDPPYNTGKEFVYSDNFEFDDERLKTVLGYTDEEVKRLKSIQGKSSHSAWLTFMYPRLKIAQRLLKEDGVIFISIDDNEQANLKLLMDDIFGEGNFVGTLSVENNPKGRKNSRFISISSEYLHIYAKNKNSAYFLENIPKNANDMIEDDDGIFIHNSGKRVLVGENNFNNAVTNSSSEKNYSVYYNNKDNSIILIKELYGEIDHKLLSKGYEKYYSYFNNQLIENTYTANKFMELFENNALEFTGNKIFEKNFNDTIRIKSQLVNKKYEAVINGKKINYSMELTTTGAGTYFKSLFNTDKLYFDTLKNIGLIRIILTLFEKEDFITLDFFAGSATTAHAVMQLNAEDGGNRKYIIVQLDEETKLDSEARKAKYSTIDEIARERIKLAGRKILTNYESDLVNQTNGWDRDIGFKHYRLVTPEIKTIDKIIEFNPNEPALITDDMIKPFEYSNTKTSGLDTILTTWLINDGFRFDTNVEEMTFGSYNAHYVHEAQKLYLINREWDTTALEDLLNQIGKNKLLVSTIVVYPYSFEFEAMRELKTNIKNNLDKPPTLIERY